MDPERSAPSVPVMRTPLVVLAVSAALGAAAPASASANGGSLVRQCGNAVVQFDADAAGGLIRVLATGVSCSAARSIARQCVNGTVRRGWSARYVRSTERIVLRSGARRVSGRLVGGGGCVD